MLAAVLHQSGPADVFSLEHVTKPVPASDEALIRVRACGVSYHDIVERNGTYKRDMHFPVILGYEIAGIVEAVGSGVTRVAPGDRVCTKAFSSCGKCRLCRSGRETTCTNRRPVRGGYAEFACVSEDALVDIGPLLAFETACTLGPSAGVALNAVRDTAKVAIGDRVMVTGATGGVGRAAIRLAAIAGATVLAVTRKSGSAEDLRAEGASEVIVWDGETNFGKTLARTGAAVDVVIDTVGSRVFDAAFAALAPHGRYAFVGQLFGEEIRINPARIFFKRAQLLGVGSVSRTQLEDVVMLAQAGRIAPRIDARFALRDIAEAHRRAESGAASGRVILIP